MDLLEMKAYHEIDLDETPIVVLGCGHFFTAETLDGHMAMAEVYVQDQSGSFTGLMNISGGFASSTPRCPDCQRPVRQYCTQRFNRTINRAVIDEMSKRFLVTGKDELRELELEIAKLSKDFDDSRKDIVTSLQEAAAHAISLTSRGITPGRASAINQQLKERRKKAQKLEQAIQRFREKVTDRHQLAQKLHDATINAVRKRPLEQMMTSLNVTDSVPPVARDRRITFGGRIAQLHVQTITITDAFNIATTIKPIEAGSSLKIPGKAPEESTTSFFVTCKAFIVDCNKEPLPKLGVEASLYYASIARLNESYCRSINTKMTEASEHVKTAKELLEQAKESCKKPFQNSEALGIAVEESTKMLGKEWYEKVTAEELTAIKAAMISGPRGFNTHSGHWYNCMNGHPVSNHSAVSGLSLHSCSLLSVNAVCQWSRRAARSVELLSGDKVIELLLGSLELRTWRPDSITSLTAIYIG